MSNSSIIYSIIYSKIRYIVIIFHYYNYKLSYIYKTHALFISIKKKNGFCSIQNLRINKTNSHLEISQ